MKKALKLILSLFLLASFIQFHYIDILAQEEGSPESAGTPEPPFCTANPFGAGLFITDWELTDPTPENLLPGETLDIRVNSINNELGLEREYYIVIGPKCSSGSITLGAEASSTIFITASGRGASQITLPQTVAGGEQNVFIVGSMDTCPALDNCSSAIPIIIDGPPLEDPPDCSNEGDMCNEASVLCSPVDTYCNMTGPFSGEVVRYGVVGERCIFWSPESAEPVYSCTDGVPSTQDNGCYCRPESLSFGMANVVANDCTKGPGWVDTAIGCIPFSLVSDTTKFFLSWSFSIGGGIGLLLIGVSAFMFVASGGNPEKLNGSKSLFFAAISGLLMLVLALFLLRFIGYDLLGLFVEN